MNIDLTNYCPNDRESKTRVIMTCNINLDKPLILDAMKSERIFIHGKFYKVPESKFLECLMYKRFGITTIDFEQVE